MKSLNCRIFDIVSEKRLNSAMNAFSENFPLNQNASDWRKWWHNELKSAILSFYTNGGNLIENFKKNSAILCYCRRFYHSKNKQELLRRIDSKMYDFRQMSQNANDFQKSILRDKYRILLNLKDRISLKSEWNPDTDEILKIEYEALIFEI